MTILGHRCPRDARSVLRRGTHCHGVPCSGTARPRRPHRAVAPGPDGGDERTRTAAPAASRAAASRAAASRAAASRAAASRAAASRAAASRAAAGWASAPAGDATAGRTADSTAGRTADSAAGAAAGWHAGAGSPRLVAPPRRDRGGRRHRPDGRRWDGLGRGLLGRVGASLGCWRSPARYHHSGGHAPVGIKRPERQGPCQGPSWGPRHHRLRGRFDVDGPNPGGPDRHRCPHAIHTVRDQGAPGPGCNVPAR